MEKVKKQYPLDSKTIFGVSTMGLSQCATTGLQTSALMLYLTDYAGMFKGDAGMATSFATLLLLIGRLFDAFINPPCGIIMDRSRRTRIGKFKPYLIGGSIFSTLSVIMLFNIPSGFNDMQKVLFVCLAYLVFDISWTLIPLLPITATLSSDAEVRGKLLVPQRIVTTLISLIFAFFITISVALGKDGVTPNMGMGTIVILVPILVITLIGTVMLKEGNVGGSKDGGKLKLRDIVTMFKMNKPLLVYSCSQIFNGFSFTLISAAATYYIKYAFGVENFGTQSAIYGVLMLLSIITGTIIAPSILRKVTPAVAMIICTCFSVIPLLILWIINFAGPITNPIILYSLLFISLIGIGMNYIPGSVLSMECMDYNKYKLGNSMEGLVSNVSNFIMNTQSALAAAITGSMLVAVGYNADLLKNTTSIPNSLFSGLGLVFFALPALVGIIASLILLAYPLRKKEKRDEMYKVLNEQNEKED